MLDPVLVALADVRQYRKRALGWLAKVEGLSAGELERIERTGELWGPDPWGAEHENTARRVEHAHRFASDDGPRGPDAPSTF